MDDTQISSIGAGVLTLGDQGSMSIVDRVAEKRDSGLAFSRRVLGSVARVRLGAANGSSVLRGLVEVLIMLKKSV